MSIHLGLTKALDLCVCCYLRHGLRYHFGGGYHLAYVGSVAKMSEHDKFRSKQNSKIESKSSNLGDVIDNWTFSMFKTDPE